MLKYLLAAWVLLYPFTQPYAQEQTVQGWYQAAIEYKATKDLDLQYTQMLRQEFFPQAAINRHLAEISATYSFNKKWRTGAEIRLANQDLQTSIRYAVFGRYREKYGDWDWSVRTKLQLETGRFNPTQTALRNKFQLGYSLNKDLGIFASYEIFYQWYYIENNFSEYRTEGGFEYSPNKHHNWNVSYFLGREIRTSNPEMRHVIALAYRYTI